MQAASSQIPAETHIASIAAHGDVALSGLEFTPWSLSSVLDAQDFDVRLFMLKF